MSLQFKVFTLNCWGIAFVSKDRKRRMQAIADYLASSDYDVVCLQELWTNRDFELIKRKVADVMPFAHYFYSGVTGSGICILSRHPIEDTFFHQWSVNGYIHKLQHGDWFGGKGVGLCRLKVNDFKINLYSAHLIAEYDPECDEYRAHRILQAFDTAQFILLTSGSSDLVVLAGDLNIEPTDLSYRIMLNVPGLIDAFTKVGKLPDNMIYTSETLRNSYTATSRVKQQLPGTRIDYVMYQPGTSQVEVAKYLQPLPDRVPNCQFSYSDHEGVAATLVLTKKNAAQDLIKKDLKLDTLQNSLRICDEALSDLKDHKRSYLILAFLILIMIIAVHCFSTLEIGYAIFYNVAKIILILWMIFAFIMGTLWNKMERHGILSGKLAMEMTIRGMKETAQTQSPPSTSKK